MDELTICNRLEEHDEWLLQVQREFRENNLSMDSHAFLHGRPTSKPGSWTNGQTTCDNPKCSEQLAAIAEDNSLECEKCKYEREKRKLVVTDKSDARLVQEVFRSAPAIFPNNDNKYHAGKMRSEAWCRWQKKTMTWSVAKDRPVHREFQSRPYLQRDKIKRLTFHDKN